MAQSITEVIYLRTQSITEGIYLRTQSNIPEEYNLHHPCCKNLQYVTGLTLTSHALELSVIASPIFMYYKHTSRAIKHETDTNVWHQS